jgi:hypothetical protein
MNSLRHHGAAQLQLRPCLSEGMETAFSHHSKASQDPKPFHCYLNPPSSPVQPAGKIQDPRSANTNNAEKKPSPANAESTRSSPSCCPFLSVPTPLSGWVFYHAAPCACGCLEKEETMPESAPRDPCDDNQPCFAMTHPASSPLASPTASCYPVWVCTHLL